MHLQSVQYHNQFLTIRTLAQRIWPSHFSSILSCGQITYMLDRLYSLNALSKRRYSGSEMYLVVHAGQCIGYAMRKKSKKPYVYHIEQVFLLPEQQRSGFAKQIVNQWCEELRKKHYKTVSLYTNVNNTTAIQCAKRLGFKIKNRVYKPINGGHYVMEDYYMSKAL